MKRSTRHLGTLALGLTILALDSLGAQTTDSTRTPARASVRDSTGAGPRMGMRRRTARPEIMGPRERDDYSSNWRRVSPGERVELGRGGFGGRGRMTRPIAMLRSRGPNPLLRGITLSTDQEKALRATHSSQLMQAKPLMMELLSARTDEQIARLNGDQKALDAASARLAVNQSRLDSLRSKRSPTGDLRSVLTPDQVKILDRNLSEFPDRRARAMDDRRPGMRGGMGPRGFRDGPPPRRPGDE
ncbi:MAG: hypothetical protein Q8K82_20980 [Gemmatimonadaceae bacterium]|nr:hypothetical protein [Gemmatimonadaceae bacterium]